MYCTVNAREQGTLCSKIFIRKERQTMSHVKITVVFKVNNITTHRQILNTWVSMSCMFPRFLSLLSTSQRPTTIYGISSQDCGGLDLSAFPRGGVSLSNYTQTKRNPQKAETSSQILIPWLGDMVDFWIGFAAPPWRAGMTTLCHSRLYPPVRDLEFGYRSSEIVYHIIIILALCVYQLSCLMLGSGSFHHQAKIVRKTLIPTVLWC